MLPAAERLLTARLGYAFGRLFRRLKVLSLGIPGPVQLSPVIVPTTDIDAVLVVPVMSAEAQASPVADGVQWLHTVGTTKRWRLKAYSVSVGAGASLSGLYIKDVSAATEGRVMAFAAGSTNLSAILALPILLDAGDQVGYYVDWASGTPSVSSQVHYEEEDAY